MTYPINYLNSQILLTASGPVRRCAFDTVNDWIDHSSAITRPVLSGVNDGNRRPRFPCGIRDSAYGYRCGSPSLGKRTEIDPEARGVLNRTALPFTEQKYARRLFSVVLSPKHYIRRRERFPDYRLPRTLPLSMMQPSVATACLPSGDSCNDLRYDSASFCHRAGRQVRLRAQSPQGGMVSDFEKDHLVRIELFRSIGSRRLLASRRRAGLPKQCGRQI